MTYVVVAIDVDTLVRVDHVGHSSEDALGAAVAIGTDGLVAEIQGWDNGRKIETSRYEPLNKKRKR